MNGTGASVRRGIRASLVAAVALGCLDPRARPVPPVVDIQFGASFRLTSPGQILGALHLVDSDGLSSVDISVLSDDSTFAADSLVGLTGEDDISRPINWTVPAGLATGSFVTVIASARDFANFTTADTVKLLVQDPLPNLR
jgi:hypothetical protein